MRVRGDSTSAGTVVDLVMSALPWPLALWTVLAQASQLAGVSLRSLAWAYSGLLSFGLVVAIAQYRRRGPRPRGPKAEADRLTSVLLGALAVGGAAIALVAIRPDADDVNYLGRVVYFLANDRTPLDLANPTIALAPQMQQGWFLFSSIELLWGFVSLVTQIPLLEVQYVVVPTVAGLLLPLAWFFLLSRFVERQDCVAVGVAAIVAFLCLDGDVHRSYGNFAFVRLWQGKALLMSIGLPMLTTFALDYFRSPGRKTWTLLCVGIIAATGLTSSALFLVPLAMAGWSVGHLAGVGVSRSSLTVTFVGALAGAYVAGIDALILVASRLGYSPLGYTDALADWIGGHSLSEQLAFVLSGWSSAASLVLYGSTLVALVVAQPKWRRFLTGWLLTVIVLAMNPWVFSFVAKHLTSYGAYWRLFWILPFPLVLGLAVARVLARRPTRRSILLGWAVSLLLAAVPNLLQWPGAVLAGLPLRPGAAKLPEPELGQARRIVTLCEPGAMIAPLSYAWILPLLSPSLPQIAPRAFSLASTDLPLADLRSRRRAVAYVSGRSKQGGSDLERLLSTALKNVLLPRELGDNEALKTSLSSARFTLAGEGTDWVLYTRHAERRGSIDATTPQAGQRAPQQAPAP